jgi:hypothetical protein
MPPPMLRNSPSELCRQIDAGVNYRHLGASMKLSRMEKTDAKYLLQASTDAATSDSCNNNEIIITAFVWW